MRLLLDTNAVLWWFSDDPTLPEPVEALIDDPANTVFVSAASAWEICTKVRIGKLPSGRALCEDFTGTLARYHANLWRFPSSTVEWLAGWRERIRTHSIGCWRRRR